MPLSAFMTLMLHKRRTGTPKSHNDLLRSTGNVICHSGLYGVFPKKDSRQAGMTPYYLVNLH